MDQFCLMCCVFDGVCELFGETIRNMFACGCYFVFNVMEVLSVGGGALLDIPCMVFQRMCVLCLGSQCASKLFLPWVLFMFLYVGSYLPI